MADLIWEAYGTSHRGLREGRVRVEVLQSLESGEFPEAELTDKIAHIQVKFELHGDDPLDAFIHVWGTDNKRVMETWHRVHTLLTEGRLATRIWA